nr:hypothetical protein [Escherichia coli]
MTKKIILNNFLFKANVALDDLLFYLDLYISELIKHNAPYSETEVLRTKNQILS